MRRAREAGRPADGVAGIEIGVLLYFGVEVSCREGDVEAQRRPPLQFNFCTGDLRLGHVGQLGQWAEKGFYTVVDLFVFVVVVKQRTVELHGALHQGRLGTEFVSQQGFLVVGRQLGPVIGGAAVETP